jgi:hypothetical protein
MASKSEIVIRVYSNRGSSTVQYTSKGRYVSFSTAGYNSTLNRQPIQPTSALKTFWESVLGIVLADITANG